MNIMESRLVHLKQVYEGYIRTHVPLVEYDGNHLLPSITADDIGIYVIMPKIAALFGISVEQAFNFFFYCFSICAFASGLIGLCFLFKDWFMRCLGLITLLILWQLSFYIGDVYVLYTDCAVAVIPWFIYLLSNQPQNNILYSLCFMMGLMGSFCHYLRAYASLPVFVFAEILIMSSTYLSRQTKIGLNLVLFFGILIPVIFFKIQFIQYASYAKQHFVEQPLIINNHIFWHPFYLGFGFLKFMNIDNITYDDNVGQQKVLQTAPDIYLNNTAIYDQVLKTEVFKLFKEQTMFVVYTIFAKIGILLMYLLIFAPGLFLRFIFGDAYHVFDSAFLGALLLSSIFPIIALPIPSYSLSFITFSALYGLFSVDYVYQIICKKIKYVLNIMKIAT